MEKKALVIALENTKGGVSKSTTAVNISYWYAKQGKKVLLIDADKQGSSWNFNLTRAENMEALKLDLLIDCVKLYTSIATHVAQHSKEYDVIVIDTPGHNSSQMREALFCANIAIIPSSPSSFDTMEVKNNIALIKEIMGDNRRLKSFFVMSKVDKREKKSFARFQLLTKEIIATHAGDDGHASGIYQLDSYLSLKSSIYRDMALTGKTVFELAKGKSGDPLREHTEVISEIYAVLQDLKEGKKVAA